MVQSNGTQPFWWKRTDEVESIVQTSDSGFALTGVTRNGEAGDPDYTVEAWLVKTDAMGVVQWNQTYVGKNIDGFTSLCQISDGGFVLAGSTSSYGSGEDDGWLIRTDANGTPPTFPPENTLFGLDTFLFLGIVISVGIILGLVVTWYKKKIAPIG